MRILYIIAAMFLLQSCGNEVDPRTTTDEVLGAAGKVTGATADTACYILAEGLTHKDTTIITLITSGSNVSGHMTYSPYEKDSRTGKIEGLKTGNHIRGKWVYMQEGLTDSMTVTFRLRNDILTQQQSVFDSETGKEYFPNTGEYDRYYKRIDCNVAQAVTGRY